MISQPVLLQDVEVPGKMEADDADVLEKSSEAQTSGTHPWVTSADAQTEALQSEGIFHTRSLMNAGATATEDSDAPLRGTQSDSELVRHNGLFAVSPDQSAS